MTEIIDTQGVIIECTPYGETSSIIDVFTEQAGLIKGYVKGARNKKNMGIYQKGNLIALIHSRRVTEQLGTIQADSLQCLWQELSKNRLYFKIFNIICQLKTLILPHYVYEPSIYGAFMRFIDVLLQSPNEKITKKTYIHYLYFILQQIGYAVDFRQCGVSGVKTNLMYVSPKSLRAICYSVGHAYHDKLLLLPKFLSNYHADILENDIDNGQKIIQLCYNKLVFYPRNIQFSICI